MEPRTVRVTTSTSYSCVRSGSTCSSLARAGGTEASAARIRKTGIRMRFTMMYRPHRVASGAAGTVAGIYAAKGHRGCRGCAGATVPVPGPGPVRTPLRGLVLFVRRCRRPDLPAYPVRAPVAVLVPDPAGCSGPLSRHRSAVANPGRLAGLQAPDRSGRRGLTGSLHLVAGCRWSPGHRTRFAAGPGFGPDPDPDPDPAVVAVAGLITAEPGPGSDGHPQSRGFGSGPAGMPAVPVPAFPPGPGHYHGYSGLWPPGSG